MSSRTAMRRTVCALVCLVLSGLAIGVEDRVRTVMLSGPNGTDPMREPNVAIDPNDPDNIVATALSRSGKAAYAYYWTSRDGLRTWTRGFLKPVKPHFDIASDPSISYGPDCSVYYAHLDFGDFQKARGLKDGDWLSEGGLGFQRSEDCGKTFTPSRIASNPSDHLQADKDWIAVDASSSGKYRGSVYVFWSFIGSLVDKSDAATDIQFAYSRDGGKSFSPPRQLSRNGYVVATSVRPDGTLDAIWEERRWNSQKIWHVKSTDGGETFSSPALVVAVAEEVVLDWPVLTATSGGSLVAAWCQRGRAFGHRFESEVYSSVWKDGSWSPPRPLEPDPAPGGWTSIPSLAATDGAVWILAYHVDARQTQVVLYRAPRDTDRFERDGVLATRHFGVRQFCPGWLDCFSDEPQPRVRTQEEQFSPGDYVGLSGAKGRVVAAYILPRKDDRRVSRLPTLYVSVIRE